MLDKTLCAAFGIDEFNQWIIKQLDYIEEQMHDDNISAPRFIQLQSAHDTLRSVRDIYCKLNLQNLKHNAAVENLEIKNFKKDLLNS